MRSADGGYDTGPSDVVPGPSAARPQPASLRVAGALCALTSGPLWAYAVTRSIVEMDHELVHDLGDTGRATYAAFWFLLTSLMLFGSSFWYFTARTRGWAVLRALRVQQVALLLVSATTLLTASIR